MITDSPLAQSYQGKANASGVVDLMFGPVVANESWHVQLINLSNPGPRVPTVTIYKNVKANIGFIDQTLNGLFGAWNGDLKLLSSEVCIVSYSLCTPNTLCSISVQGLQVNEVPWNAFL